MMAQPHPVSSGIEVHEQDLQPPSPGSSPTTRTARTDDLGATGGSLSASRSLSSSERPPTLTFPTLHLGSFNALNVDSFPSPPTSARPSISSPTRPSEDWPRDDYLGSAFPPPPHKVRDGSGALISAPTAQVFRRESGGSDNPTQSLHPARSRESSRGSIRSRGHIPPPLPPPTTALPPLPLLSPISPLSSLSPGGSGNTFAQHMLRSTSGTALAPPINSSPSRPVGAPLAINIPSPAQFMDADKAGSGSSAILKSSPGIPRTRTLVDGKRNDRASEVRLSGVNGGVEYSPRLQASPEDGQERKVEASPSSPSHRLEKKPSTNNLRASPTSPTAKRTLPRPPISGPPSFDTPARADPSSSTQPSPRTMPKPSTATTPLATYQQQALGPQQQLQPPQHRTTNSASALPIISGLADAGPYPSSRPTSIKGQQGTIGRGPGPRPPMQEEICLECMMRDRDLADVTVIGDDAWERASNDAWEESKRRELDLLASLGRSQEYGSDTEEGSLSASPPSTSYSVEGAEQQRRIMAAKKGKARRAEKDQIILQKIGWRGFKWEEGSSGEGLPRAFRGTKGGRLTEDAIKAVMIKFPSASAHRYNWLQGYLRHQYMLTVEIAAEAKRLGYFPTPVEIVYSPATSHEAFMPGLQATGSRTSSLAWDNTQTLPRQSIEYQQQRNPYSSSPVAIPPSLVRPSPSSPADLAMGARPARAIPNPRPTTHFIPDREPNPNPITARQKLNVQTTPSLTPGGLGSRDRWGTPDPGDDGLWPPISPAESGMRPFSFAVRAGAGGGDRGSDGGHGRRSIFGRWGGSVTSFFGGSQGGSGSMMDMHLGLDSDRRNQASSQYIHAQPRAVSLASPTRPAFFGRDSRSSSTDVRTPIAADRTGRSMSNSRLSQVLRSDENDYTPAGNVPAPTPKKEKGFKGLLQKMKPKSRKSLPGPRDQAQLSSPYQPAQQQPPYPQQQPRRYRQQSSQPEYQNSQLQPPPSLNYLVGGRGDGGQHNRNRSGSSSSMLTDDPGNRPNSTVLQGGGGGMRSVSAPFAGSSSGGSQNNSPTSSRFDKYGNGAANGRRGSYASLSNRPGSGYEADLARESIVEVLSGQGQREMGSMPSRQSEDRYDHPSSNGNGANGNGYQQHQSNPNYRPANKTTSSLSASSVVQTPPAPSQSQMYANTANSTTYFSQSNGGGRAMHVKTPSDGLSPSRFKNLPPLPPPGADGPEPAFAQHQQYQQMQKGQSPYPGPSPNARSTPHTNPQYRPVQDSEPRVPRASFDPSPMAREREYNQPSPRLAQSMYAQPSAGASSGSLGSFARGYGQSNQVQSQGQGQQRYQSQGDYGQRAYSGDAFARQGQGQWAEQGGWSGEENVVDLGSGTGKGTVGRRGLKGLFGKAGRMA